MNQLESRRQNDATIEDVATAAQVSIRTVSRVLNKSPKVKEDTRKRVDAAIAALQFRPSSRARALAMGRSLLIGLVHNDRNALVLDSIQRGLVSATAQSGYELIVHPTPLGAEQAISDVLEFAERSRVDGLIVLPPVSETPGLAEALANVELPAVALSSVPVEGFMDVIVSEERAAGAQVARFLIDLGHRKLGIINGPANTASAVQRRAGFVEEALLDGGTKISESAGDYSFLSGVEAAEYLLSLPDRPTGIFAANDIMAAGLLKVAARRGIRVPEELSVVGFDGSLITQMLTPAIASVHRPFGQLAGAAAELLIARIEGRELPSNAPVVLRLVTAESTGPAPSCDS